MQLRNECCVLCNSMSAPFGNSEKTSSEYLQCSLCEMIFLRPALRLSPGAERARYQNHQHSEADLGYQIYLAPMLAQIRKHCVPGGLGLDFGCGPQSLIQEMLKDEYNFVGYDPFFRNDETYKQNKYDFILAIEVVEHFFGPASEFKKLRSLLKENGSFGIMTSLFNPRIDFSNWHYRRDPTHVCFYTSKTLQWIKDSYGFKNLESLDTKTHWFSL